MKKFLLIALAFVSISAAAQNMTTKLVVNNPICYGTSTGSIELYVFGGTPPFTYTWDNGLPSTTVQTNLAAGLYSVTVSDNTGDVVNATVLVAQPDEIQVTAQILNVSSPGGNDGAIGLSVDGGTPNYDYSWSNSVNDKNISSLTAGTYTVEITDAVGCSKMVSVVVTEPGGMLAEKPEDKYFVPNTPFPGSGNMPGGGDGSNGKTFPITGMEEVRNVEPVVYPNPATNFFNIKMESGAETQLALMNLNGQVVAQQNTNSPETQMNVSNLPNGNYILSVKSENGMATKVVVIQK